MSIAVGGYSSGISYYTGRQPINSHTVNPANATYEEFMALGEHLVEIGWLEEDDMQVFERPAENTLEKEDYLNALRQWRDKQMNTGNMEGYYKASKVCNAIVNFRDEQTGNITTVETAGGPVRAYRCEASLKSYLIGYHVLFDADGTSRGIQASYAADSTAENPVVEVRIIDENGNTGSVYRVNINDVDPANASQLEMFALCSHAEKQGITGEMSFGQGYRNLLEFASNAGFCADTQTFIHEKKDWITLLCDEKAEELVGQHPVYSGWRELFFELLEQCVEDLQERAAKQKEETEEGEENQTDSHIIEKADGSKVLELINEIGGMKVRTYLEVEKPERSTKMQQCLKAYGRDSHIQYGTVSNNNCLGDAVTVAEREEEGEFLGLTMIPEEGQSMTYGMRAMLPESSTPDKPIVQIVSNLGGKNEVYNVDISKIDPENASQIEMFALCSYADKRGLGNSGTFGSYQKIKYYADNAQTNGYCRDLDGVGNFFHTKLNWKEIISKMMTDYLNTGIYKQYQDGVSLLGLFNKF